MWIMSPPRTAVTALVTCWVAEPPQGPAFCGSPRALSTIQEEGSLRMKCASAAAGMTAAAAAMAIMGRRPDKRILLWLTPAWNAQGCFALFGRKFLGAHLIF